MNFRFLTGDVNWVDYGGKFISKKLNNGDFDYWLVLDFINMHEATGEETQDKYVVQILSVSPQEAGEEHVKSAFRCIGFDKEPKDTSDIERVLALSEYGIYATIWSSSGNNASKLIREAHKQILPITSLYGFYMDKRENLIGNTGWDFIKGDIGFKQEVRT